MTNSNDKILNHKLARNTLWLLSSEMASRLLAFWVVIQLANSIGARAYGELSYAFAVANLLVPIADFGLTTYLIRTLTRRRDETSSLVGMLFALKIFLSIFTLGIMIVTGIMLENIPLGLIIAGGIAIILTNMRMFCEGVFRAHERMHFEAISKLFAVCALTTVLLFLLWSHATLETIAAGYAIVAGGSVIVALILIWLRVTPLKFVLDPAPMRSALGASLPFAAAIALNMVLNYADSAMLGAWGHTQEVGWYNAAYKPIFFLTAIAGMIVAAFFPVIANEYHHARNRVGQTVRRLLQTNMMIAFPMAVGGTILAPRIIDFLYVDAYQPAVLAFQILLWSTFLIYFWASFGNSLQACDRERIYLKGFAIAVFVNIALNLIVIPRWNLYGAAAATLVAQIVLAFFFAWKFRAIAIVPIFSTLWHPAFAATFMGMTLTFFPSLSVVFALIFGAIVYVIVLIAIGGIKKQELSSLLSLWKKNSP